MFTKMHDIELQFFDRNAWIVIAIIVIIVGLLFYMWWTERGS